MEADFWHRKWQKGELGFHEGRPNTLLTAHLATLGPGQGARVFVPLCGKSVDLHWLLGQGYRVAGVELSALAVGELFRNLGLEPVTERLGALTRYCAQDIDVFVGDIFDLSAQDLGPVHAVYDRAALVALPYETRTRYAAHMAALGGVAPQLAITFEYDQSLIDGPPFSVDADEVGRLYGGLYRSEVVARREVEGGLKGVAATETAWVLRPVGSGHT